MYSADNSLSVHRYKRPHSHCYIVIWYTVIKILTIAVLKSELIWSTEQLILCAGNVLCCVNKWMKCHKYTLVLRLIPSETHFVLQPSTLDNPPHRLSILQRRPENIQISPTLPVLRVSCIPTSIWPFVLTHHPFFLTKTPSLVPSAASSSSPRAASDLEQARPQTSGEEELQLQLALAMSREESQKVKQHTHAHTNILW